MLSPTTSESKCYLSMHPRTHITFDASKYLVQISTALPAHSSMGDKANTVQLHVLLRLMLGFRSRK
ncbi:hypothetical protein L873DRAFT_1411524 [Choiromyces venosus 120613-1]|uniref:Uncharacterized protein n=1 Tax=Choiromyces venosus 120613-1 TaxID=1336337 RepID=A0A3N4JB82_9PEZI|nr:hypothetical protein L873DRAFT_1411524 [Choiromyces venosus 120613-1]